MAFPTQPATLPTNLQDTRPEGQMPGHEGIDGSGVHCGGCWARGLFRGLGFGIFATPRQRMVGGLRVGQEACSETGLWHVSDTAPAGGWNLEVRGAAHGCTEGCRTNIQNEPDAQEAGACGRSRPNNNAFQVLGFCPA